jgi:hypothetical protein
MYADGKVKLKKMEYTSGDIMQIVEDERQYTQYDIKKLDSNFHSTIRVCRRVDGFILHGRMGSESYNR